MVEVWVVTIAALGKIGIINSGIKAVMLIRKPGTVDLGLIGRKNLPKLVYKVNTIHIMIIGINYLRNIELFLCYTLKDRLQNTTILGGNPRVLT
jgi:hypothetical protein